MASSLQHRLGHGPAVVGMKWGPWFWGAKLHLLFTKGLWGISVGGKVMGCRWLRMGKSSKAGFGGGEALNWGEIITYKNV